MFCDQCGQRVDPAARRCPHCGATLAPVTTPSSTSGPSVPRQREASDPAPTTAHLPRRRFPTGLASGLLGRNLRGTTSGIVGAWFGVPFILLMAAFGGVIGGIGGLVNGTFIGPGVLDRMDRLLNWGFALPFSVGDLLPTVGVQIGGIVGAILGALNGAWELGWRAAVWPWEALYREDPLWPVQVAAGQVVSAIIVGLLFVLGSAVTERGRFYLAGARRLSRRETTWLLPLYEQVAGRMGLTSVPVLLIDERRNANAYTGLRHIVLHQGLLDELAQDREAIAAVLAHELGHWRAGDASAMAWAKGVALPLYVLYEIGYRLLGVRFRPLQWLIRMLLWSVLVTVRYLVLPVQRHVWRECEYKADAAAAAAGYGESLRRALSHVRSFEAGRGGWEETVHAMHPPVELRMERLETPGRVAPARDDLSLASSLLEAPTSSVHRGAP